MEVLIAVPQRLHDGPTGEDRIVQQGTAEGDGAAGTTGGSCSISSRPTLWRLRQGVSTNSAETLRMARHQGRINVRMASALIALE